MRVTLFGDHVHYVDPSTLFGVGVDESRCTRVALETWQWQAPLPPSQSRIPPPGLRPGQAGSPFLSMAGLQSPVQAGGLAAARDGAHEWQQRRSYCAEAHGDGLWGRVGQQVDQQSSRHRLLWCLARRPIWRDIPSGGLTSTLELEGGRCCWWTTTPPLEPACKANSKRPHTSPRNRHRPTPNLPASISRLGSRRQCSKTGPSSSSMCETTPKMQGRTMHVSSMRWLLLLAKAHCRASNLSPIPTRSLILLPLAS
jgi:hypothetical protein